MPSSLSVGFAVVSLFAPAVPWFVILNRARHQPIHLQEWALGGAFMVSVFADLAMWQLPASNWWVFYLYVPLQVALFCYATNERPWLKIAYLLTHIGLIDLAALFGAVVLHWSPERLAGLAAAFTFLSAIGWIDRRSSQKNAVYVYCCGGALFLFGMAVAMMDRDPGWLFWASYGGYHVTKFAGLALAVMALNKPLFHVKLRLTQP